MTTDKQRTIIRVMTQIKSERAECILNDAKQSNIEGCPVSLGAATKAVIVAETEADERHKKQIEEIIQAQATRLYMIACDRADELQKLRIRAIEAHKSQCVYLSADNYRDNICHHPINDLDESICDCKCMYMIDFINNIKA